MRRFLLPSLVTAAAVALLALLAFGVASQGTSSSIDAAVARGRFPPVPNATLQLPVLGSNVRSSLAAYRGRVVLLNVFASWCQPCKAEAPILEQAQQMMARRDGTVLGVTYLDNSSDSETFVHQQHLTYPVIRDVNGNFVRSLGTDAVPESFVINRNGRIEALRRYQLSAQWVRETLPKILAERS